MLFLHIGNYDMPRILSVQCHVQNRSDAVAVDMTDFFSVHQFVISNQYLHAIYRGLNAFTADFLDVRHAVSVNFFSVSGLETFADRM